MQSLPFEFGDKARKILVTFLLVLAGVNFFAYLELPDKKLHFYFLDVGQGDSILLKTPENHQILIDGGPGKFLLSQLNEVMPFFDKSIDLVILTHPHKDHVEGLIHVLQRFEVKNVLLTGAIYDSDVYQEFLRILVGLDANILIAESESDFAFGELHIDVLYPFEQMLDEPIANINNASIATKIVYGDNTFLLTGDLEAEIEEKLVEKNLNLKADLLKVPHHGSKTSSTEKFLAKVKPEIAVVQVGRNNNFGHPAEIILERLKKFGVKEIYRTDLDGRVEFVY